MSVQNDGVLQPACCSDWSSNLSDFVDSLLASDSTLYTFECNADESTNASCYNHAIVDPEQQLLFTNGTTNASADTCSTTAIVRPAYSRDHVRQRTCIQKKTTCNRNNRNRMQKCVRRTITNNTYLRRLYLSPVQAVYLIPGIKKGSTPITLSRKHRALVQEGSKNSRYDVDLVLSDGRRWASAFECVVSANGQLHCRLVNGWSRFCQDNGIAVHDSVVLEASNNSSNEIVVFIERKAG